MKYCDCEKYCKLLKNERENYHRALDDTIRLKQENEQFKEYQISKENSYKNLQKEWQLLQWIIRKLTTENKRQIECIKKYRQYGTPLAYIAEQDKIKEISEIKAKNIKIKKELLYINREIASIANDGLTHPLIKSVLLGLNHGLSDIIREMREC